MTPDSASIRLGDYVRINLEVCLPHARQVILEQGHPVGQVLLISSDEAGLPMARVTWPPNCEHSAWHHLSSLEKVSPPSPAERAEIIQRFAGWSISYLDDPDDAHD